MTRAFLFGLVFLSLSCGDDDGIAPETDAGPTGMDAGVRDAGPEEAGVEIPDAFFLDAGPLDAGPAEEDAGPLEDDAGPVDEDAGSVGGCGWSDDEGGWACGASDTMPDEASCEGTNCCVGECAPGAGDQLSCCDSATGEITSAFYSGGTCEDGEGMACGAP